MINRNHILSLVIIVILTIASFLFFKGDCDCTKIVTKSNPETGEVYSVDTIADHSSNCKSAGSATGIVDGVQVDSEIICIKK